MLPLRAAAASAALLPLLWLGSTKVDPASRLFLGAPLLRPPPPPLPLQCTDEVAQFASRGLDAPQDYPLVIGVFTGEFGRGYKGYENRGYKDRRTAIRQSWLREAALSGVPAFFVMSSWNLTAEHRREMLQHRDILLLDDPEGLAWGYRGLVHKTLLILHLMARQCATYTYFLKTDDDTFVHIPNTLALVHSSPTTLAMIGYQQPSAEVLLDGGVWDNREFVADTGLRAYPRYFLGGGYLLTGDVVRALGTLARAIPLHRWPVEDTTLSAWLMGWNLTRISINHRYLDFQFIHHATWVRRFCRNDWLIVHHINIETWHLLVPRCRRAPPAAAYTGFEED